MQIKKEDPGLQKVIYGAFGLPFGLALIVICGGELYTGNAAFMPAAMMEGKCTILQLLKNWCAPLHAPQPGTVQACLLRACMQAQGYCLLVTGLHSRAMHARRFFSFFGNLVGSLFIVMLVDETLLFAAQPIGTANAIATAHLKLSAPWWTTVVRGLMCNWLVRTPGCYCQRALRPPPPQP
jgi:formate/nitrite transporter FocA (FNT family)